jgi:1-acyl-sn-glycerol-3-phosphate acyltransferase
MQSFLRLYSQLTLALLTRTSVTGREHIPPKGPLLIVANHLSTLDPPLLMAALPRGTRFVGPGDFKLLFPANLFVRWNRVITVRRSTQMELGALKQMTDVLNSGGMLAIFPEGGTWEKSLYEAKPGAAYLSLVTGAPILPIGLGGTYRAWYKVARLQFPAVSVNIGEVMPPVTAPDRAKRAEALEIATREMMTRINDLLPPADRAWYAEQARRRYDLAVEVWRGNNREMVEIPGRAALGEVLVKPNLISPLIRNARLPLDPLLHPGVRLPPASVRLAAEKMHAALTGPFSDYMEYRLGEEKSRDLYAALSTLTELASTPGVTAIALTSHIL